MPRFNLTPRVWQCNMLLLSKLHHVGLCFCLLLFNDGSVCDEWMEAIMKWMVTFSEDVKVCLASSVGLSRPNPPIYYTIPTRQNRDKKLDCWQLRGIAWGQWYLEVSMNFVQILIRPWVKTEQWIIWGDKGQFLDGVYRISFVVYVYIACNKILRVSAAPIGVSFLDSDIGNQCLPGVDSRHGCCETDGGFGNWLLGVATSRTHLQYFKK